ncbi:unnamed protein product [Rhizophagus irregularis]|uniref:Uncharacterized protein n=1 Tax=Rhizophagus irregularis TaxID=588596 RepID=A0A915YP99_9GLOM|nr:unnamed protein product [Rhizophagus irregularis]CAB5215772.1 unnamed protein product [Rhizophagus irregularis]CAB5303450.1 unnamed protein product [Rhizophagus irregularis]
MRYLIFCALCFLFAYNKSGSHLPKLGNTFPIYDFFVLSSDIETDRDESREEGILLVRSFRGFSTADSERGDLRITKNNTILLK